MFSEGINLYHFKRLPFGLSCSASIFVRQLQTAMAPLLKQGWMKSYLYDIIVSAPSYQQLLQRLGEVCKHMGTMDIKLNISKCPIGQTEIKFLGHIVFKEGFRPDPGNIEAITKMKAPTNLKEVRRFIGMVGFYRKHVLNFSKIPSPLTDLTRKNQAYKWMVECQQAFEELKTLLIKAPILAKAKLSKQFILETDASQRHIAAVLLQYDEEGLPRTIGYYQWPIQGGGMWSRAPPKIQKKKNNNNNNNLHRCKVNHSYKKLLINNK